MKNDLKPSILLVILMVIVCGSAGRAQDVDPFYMNLLEKGEKCFFNRDYNGAIKNLKIAYFGIQNQDELKARACVYLGLSHYYLKNSAEGAKYLQEAEEILGEEGINSLSIDQGVKLDLIRLTNAFRTGRTIRAEGLQALPRAPRERASQSIDINKDQVERLIKAHPRNLSHYYELYSYYRFKNNFKEAKKTIEKLVKNNPEDIFGRYLLGIILYRERKFEDAASQFSLFLQHAQRQDVRDDLQAETRAYLILSHYYLGDREQANSLIEASRQLLKSNSIPSLSLSDKDKIVLNSLLQPRKE